jgi:predicted aspartyl protease
MVNGQGPFQMLLDTGATSSILTPQAAARARVAPDQRSVMVTFSGEKVVPESSRNVIQVGQVRESGLPIIIMDLPRVRDLYAKADGVIGQTFFDRVPYLLDYKRQTLWLGEAATEESGRLSKAVQAVRTANRTLIPVTFEPGGHVWQLQLDSGATNAVVNCLERCPSAANLASQGRLLTQTGEQSAMLGTLRRISIGGHAMPSADAVLMEAAQELEEGVVPARWFDAFYVNGQTVRFNPAR